MEINNTRKLIITNYTAKNDVNGNPRHLAEIIDFDTGETAVMDLGYHFSELDFWKLRHLVGEDRRECVRTTYVTIPPKEYNRLKQRETPSSRALLMAIYDSLTNNIIKT